MTKCRQLFRAIHKQAQQQRNKNLMKSLHRAPLNPEKSSPPDVLSEQAASLVDFIVERIAGRKVKKWKKFFEDFLLRKFFFSERKKISQETFTTT
jgi:hypothetical protein